MIVLIVLVREPSIASGVLSGGVTYTRWGHNTCPSVPGTRTMYTGRMAGAHYSTNGGGANFLCLPTNPEYYALNTYSSTHYSKIYGTEYELPIAGSHEHNVPCAICHATTRTAKMMIPAKTSCPPRWTREYYGYLQSEGNFPGRERTEYVCVDKDQVSLYGSHADINGAVIYHVKAECHGIQCPPYKTANNRVLTCTVCTN